MAACVKRIAITGAPSSGKTFVIGEIINHFKGKMLSVPEVPTIFFNNGLLLDQWLSILSREKSDKKMMRSIVCLRLDLEREFEKIARLAGASIILIDRGCPDAAAYLDEPQFDYHIIFNRSLEQDISSYHCVIQLESVATSDARKDAFYCRKATDPQIYRIDLIQEKLKVIWSQNNNYYFVKASADISDKLHSACRIIENYI